MRITVFHGSPRKGNTYKATKIFMDEMSKCGDVEFLEFFLPDAIPEFCIGCQICFGNPHEKCPHSQFVTPKKTLSFKYIYVSYFQICS